jgi:hypothetical protein
MKIWLMIWNVYSMSIGNHLHSFNWSSYEQCAAPPNPTTSYNMGDKLVVLSKMAMESLGANTFYYLYAHMSNTNKAITSSCIYVNNSNNIRATTSW